MKFVISLCLLLAAGCSALHSPKDIDFLPFLRMQEKVMRSLISAHSASDDTNLINECFGHYMTDQKDVLEHYNTRYSGCVLTSQSAKNELTAKSDEQRNDLLARSDGMCTSLKSCEVLVDGLEFFDCYRNASADSYKVMFTLNNDANSQYNTISTKYSRIDSDLKGCVDDARLEYARELEECDSDFNVCIHGGEVSKEPIPEPTTEAPIRDSTAEDPATVEDTESMIEHSPLFYKNALDKLKSYL